MYVICNLKKKFIFQRYKNNVNIDFITHNKVLKMGYNKD